MPPSAEILASNDTCRLLQGRFATSSYTAMGSAPYTNIATATVTTFPAPCHPEKKPKQATRNIPIGTSTSVHANVKESQVKTNCFSPRDAAMRWDRRSTPITPEAAPRRLANFKREKSMRKRRKPMHKPASSSPTRIAMYGERELIVARPQQASY